MFCAGHTLKISSALAGRRVQSLFLLGFRLLLILLLLLLGAAAVVFLFLLFLPPLFLLLLRVVLSSISLVTAKTSSNILHPKAASQTQGLLVLLPFVDTLAAPRVEHRAETLVL